MLSCTSYLAVLSYNGCLALHSVTLGRYCPTAIVSMQGYTVQCPACILWIQGCTCTALRAALPFIMCLQCCTALHYVSTGMYSPIFCVYRAILPYILCLHCFTALYSVSTWPYYPSFWIYMAILPYILCLQGYTAVHSVSTWLYCLTYCVYMAILPLILCLQGCAALYSVSTGLYCPTFCVCWSNQPYILCLLGYPALFCVYMAILILPYILCLQGCTALHSVSTGLYFTYNHDGEEGGWGWGSWDVSSLAYLILESWPYWEPLIYRWWISRSPQALSSTCFTVLLCSD